MDVTPSYCDELWSYCKVLTRYFIRLYIIFILSYDLVLLQVNHNNAQATNYRNL